jgi:hypothetical protein
VNETIVVDFESERYYRDVWYILCLQGSNAVHVSASASAIDDQKNLETARNVTKWETGRRVQLYPPPHISLGSSFDHSTYGTDSPRRRTSEIEQEIEIPDEVPSSPSQIPDSQPPTPPRQNLYNNIDIGSPEASQTWPSQHHAPATPDAIDASPRHPSVYQAATRPPRASSLQPLDLTPQRSEQRSETTDSSVSPDRRPDKYPVFTSTPKSKPLKSLLPPKVDSLRPFLISGTTGD